MAYFKGTIDARGKFIPMPERGAAVIVMPGAKRTRRVVAFRPGKFRPVAVPVKHRGGVLCFPPLAKV